MNNDQVGKISYAVTIDVSALKAGTKTAEQAVKTSFGGAEQSVTKSTNNMNQSIGTTVAQLGLLTASILALRKVGNFLGDSIDSANKFQSSMLGLQSVASSFIGDSEGATKAAEQLSSDGLLPLADAATGLKNLLAAGYGLDDAITLMNRFKDSAAFGRQGSLSFGEAVRTATEGIKNGNSILVDNAGVTKNLSVILQEAGFSAQDMQHASTDLGVRMAILNGIVKETNPQLGDAAKLADTAAGADSKLAFSVNQLEIRTGQLANTLRKDLVESLAETIGANEDTIISIGAGASVFLGLATIIPTVVVAIGILSTALKALGIAGAVAQARALGIIGAISALVGIVAGMTVQNLLTEMDKTADASDKASGGIKELGNQAAETADATEKLTDKLAKINKDYLYNLAEIVDRHKKSIQKITQDLEDENAKYNSAVRERINAFKEEQYKEEQQHGDKVKTLQNQIDFLSKYRTAANNKQLVQLKFALAQENAQYAQRTSEQQARFDEEAVAQQQAHDKSVAELQTRLDEEQSVLTKHAADVKSVRGIMLKDEIDKLKESRDQQIKSAQEAVAGMSNAYTSPQSQKIGEQSGNAFGEAIGNGIVNALGRALQTALSDLISFGTYSKATAAINDLSKSQQANAKMKQDAIANVGEDFRSGKITAEKRDQLLRILSRASGGPATAGQPYFVGDNPDGSINRTTELFVPRTSGTIVPADEVQKAMGGSSGNTYQITIPITGAIVTSPQDQRRFAEVIGKRLNEIMTQKGFKPSIQGV